MTRWPRGVASPLVAAAALIATPWAVRAQSCVDDADGVMLSYGLTCELTVSAYPVNGCAQEMSSIGWPVPVGTTVADECPSLCNVCTDTSHDDAADDLQDNLPSEQQFLNVAHRAPAVASGHSSESVAARVTDGYAGPSNEWVSASKPPTAHWVIVSIPHVAEEPQWIESIYVIAGEQPASARQDHGVCSWQLLVWAGDSGADLATVQAATTGWVVATHSHPNDPIFAQHTKHMNFPPVRTPYVKLLIDQTPCGADSSYEEHDGATHGSMASFTSVAEIQIISCVICTAPPVDDPDYTGQVVNTFDHTLVGYWAIDDHTLRDYAGGDNNAEIHGNVVVTRDPARGPVLEFFGTPQSYVEVPTAPEFDLNTYTVMFWVQAYDIGRKQCIFAHGESFESDFPPDIEDKVHDDNIDKAQYVIFLREDGHIQHWSESAGRDEHSMGAHAATETDFYSSTDFQVRERTWVHFAVSRGEDNAVQFYINGQLDSHHTPEDGFNDPHFQHILTFGARTQGNGRYQNWFTGTLDDIRLFSAEVSAATVTQIYHESSQVMCDAGALAELMNSVNHACCDDPDVAVDCGAGVPSACSVDCSTAFLPLWHTCHEYLIQAGDDFSRFADQCGQAQAAGAQAECGYVEIIPIIMACTDIGPDEDFCTSSCYAHIRGYTHACYGMMPAQATEFLHTMEAQTDQCNGQPGTADRDIGASCDVYSIFNACSDLGYDTIAGALRAEDHTDQACQDKLVCLGSDGDGDIYESTDPTDQATCLTMPDKCYWDPDAQPGGPFQDLVQNCKPLPQVETACGDGESPQLEIVCESRCTQELLGSFSQCSVEPALTPIFQSHCSEVVDYDGDGDIDLDDQECTNRGDSIFNGTDVCPISGHGTGPISLGGSQCPGMCTGEHAPLLCDNNAVDGDPNDPINGGDGDGNDGLCRNDGICIDWTHNTAFLPRCTEDNPECFITEPGDAPDWLVEMFPDANPDYLTGYDNVLLGEDEMMCGCKGSRFSGRFCSCTNVQELIQSCQVTEHGEQCGGSLAIMDNELSNLCGIAELTSGTAVMPDGSVVGSDTECSMQCANLFSPFFSICGDTLWPTKDPLGNPLPTSGPVYESMLAQGVDVVFNNRVASFSQQCALALPGADGGGRGDGQADYCVAKPCEECNGEDGCGWCMGRNVCSNECVTTEGECELTDHNADGSGVVDPCAAIGDCATCAHKPSCGWCLDGGRNVCSSTCGLEQTVDDCNNFNEHIHDSQGAGTGENGDNGADACDCAPGTGWEARPADGSLPGCRAGSTTSLNDAAHCHQVAPPPPPSGILEVGQVQHDVLENVVVHYHSFFADPILLIGIPSAYGQEQLYIRARSVDTDARTFTAFLDVPSGPAPLCNPSKVIAPFTQHEIFSWMIVDSGEITEGLMHHGRMEAGKGTYGICSGGELCTPANGCPSCDHSTGLDWMTIPFTTPISNPVVISQVQSHTGGDWVKTRHRNVGSAGFDAKIEEDSLDTGHNTEVVGWFAVESGIGVLNEIHYEAQVTPEAVSDSPYPVSWSANHASLAPGLFAQMQTFNEGDPAHIRQRQITQNQAQIFVEENGCTATGLQHASEVVGVLVVDLGVGAVPPPPPPPHGGGGGH